MKLITAILVSTIWLSVFISPVLAAVVTNPTKSPQTSQSDEIIQLRADLQKYRDENYQNVIKQAESATSRADSLIGWMVALATTLGVFIAVVSFIFGTNLYNLLTELRKHVNQAKTNAKIIEGLGKDAELKMKTLSDEIDSISKSKGRVNESENELNKLISGARETVAEIKALSNSASFISSASITPSLSPSKFGTWQTLSSTLGSMAGGNENIMDDYTVNGRKNLGDIGPGSR